MLGARFRIRLTRLRSNRASTVPTRHPRSACASQLPGAPPPSYMQYTACLGRPLCVRAEPVAEA